MRFRVGKLKWKPIKEGDYFKSLESINHHTEDGKRQPVIVYDRVSSDNQNRNGNLEARRNQLVSDVEEKGFEVVKVFVEVADGRSRELDDRLEFYKAVELAKAMDVPIVSPSVDRVIRPDEYTKTNQSAPLLYRDVVRLFWPTDKCAVIATLIPPGVSARSGLTKRGQAGKNKRGGRPRKTVPGAMKERRERYRPIALNLHRSGKYSLRKIVQVLKERFDEEFALTTIHEWITKLTNDD